MNDPSIPELVRRLDDITRVIERVTSTLESSYLRKDVYDARHTALRREVEQKFTEVEGDVDDLRQLAREQAAFRRQILAGAIVGLILMVAQIFLVLTRIPGGGS